MKNEVLNPEIEFRINQLLKHTLACYFSLKKKKQHDLALAVLRFGSAWADFALDITGVRNFYKKEVSRLTVSRGVL